MLPHHLDHLEAAAFVQALLMQHLAYTCGVLHVPTALADETLTHRARAEASSGDCSAVRAGRDICIPVVHRILTVGAKLTEHRKALGRDLIRLASWKPT